MRTSQRFARHVYPNQGEWQMVMWKAGFLTRLRDSELMTCARFCS